MPLEHPVTVRVRDCQPALQPHTTRRLLTQPGGIIREAVRLGVNWVHCSN